MPRFLRLKNKMVHIPSLSSVSIHTNCLGRPALSLYYHNSKENTKISYAQWTLCEEDFNRVKAALAEVESLLSQIPLTEVKEAVPAPVEATKEDITKVDSVKVEEK